LMIDVVFQQPNDTMLGSYCHIRNIIYLIDRSFVPIGDLLQL